MTSTTPSSSLAAIEKAAQDWDGYYESTWSLPGIVNARLKPRLASWASRVLPQGARVLDIGCARGDFLNLIGQKRPDVELVGVDLSPGMVGLAKKRFPHLKVSQGDGTRLPFADGSFDLVTVLDTLTMLNPERAAPALVREACRVSRCWVAAEIKVPSILRLQLAIRETLTRIPGMQWLAHFLFAALPPSLKPECHVHRPEGLLTGLQEESRVRPWPLLPTPTRVHVVRLPDRPEG